MTQKVIQVGTSAAVIIPKESLKELGMKVGDRVQVEVRAEDKSVTVRPLATVDQELVSWTKDFIQKYHQALEALARQ